jgi:hypothetical protein
VNQVRVFGIILAALVISSCAAGLNADFQGFVESQLKKNQDMNFSIVKILVSHNPWRTIYEQNEVWQPVSPVNKADGIEIIVKLGGGTEKVYSFQSFSSEGNILTMGGEDGSELKLQVDGFDTTRTGSNKSIVLTALDNTGAKLVVPVLSNSGGWQFERAGQAVMIAGSSQDATVNVSTGLLYRVVVPGGMEGVIGIKDYDGKNGRVEISRVKVNIGETASGEIIPAAGYTITSLKYRGDRITDQIIPIDGLEYDYNEDFPNGYMRFEFAVSADVMSYSAVCDIEFVAEFEKARYSILPNTLPAEFANGRIASIKVNGLAAFEAFMGDTVTVETAGDWTDGGVETGRYVLKQNGLTYTKNGGLQQEAAIIQAANEYTNGTLNGKSRGVFTMPARSITLNASFEDTQLSHIELNIAAADTTFDIGDVFNSAHVIVNGYLNGSGQTIDLSGAAVFTVTGTAGGVFIEAGVQTVTVTARGKVASYTVNVSAGNAAAMRMVNGRSFMYTKLLDAITACSGGTADNPSVIMVIADIAIHKSGTVFPPELQGPHEHQIVLASGKHIRLEAAGQKTIKRNNSPGGVFGELIKVESGASLTVGGSGLLILDGGAVWSVAGNPTAAGSSNDTGISADGPLVKAAGGAFVLTSGGRLTNNQNNGTDGGAVYAGTGTFTMTGGEIIANSSQWGGGVVIDSGAAFSISGGTIKHNLATNGGGGISTYGAVTISGSAVITENKSNGGFGGGGVLLMSGSTVMTGGTISRNGAKGNSLENRGGGVNYYYYGTADTIIFNMTGGVINGNTVETPLGGMYYGKGVCFDFGSSPSAAVQFKMSGAAVVAADNDVYLGESRTLTLAGPLTAANAAVITPSTYALDTQVVDVAPPFTDNAQITAAITKLSLTQNGIGTINFIESAVIDRGKIKMAHVSRTANGKITYYSGLTNAINEATGTAQHTITLFENITQGTPIDVDGNVTLTVSATSTGDKTITYAGNDTSTLFTVNTGKKLTITGVYAAGAAKNIILDGSGGTYHSNLVQVQSGATFNMLNYSKLQNYLRAVDNSGTFTMSGGTIDNINYALTPNSAVHNNTGGIFTMSGGVIQKHYRSNSHGGAVQNYGTFTMSGGTIQQNKSIGGGGAVYNGFSASSFTMSGGTIQNNTAESLYMGGGAVYNDGGSTFTMSGGTIQGNTATNNVGAVYHSGSTFIMSGGTISGNSVGLSKEGSGVYIEGTFARTFNVSGNAVIQPSGAGANDVYLPSSNKITLIGNLSGGVDGKNMIITPNVYPTAALSARTRVVDGAAYLTPANLDRILVTPQTPTLGNAITWNITGSTNRAVANINDKGKLTEDQAAITIVERDDVQFAFGWPGTDGYAKPSQTISVTVEAKTDSPAINFDGWTLSAELDNAAIGQPATGSSGSTSLSLSITIPAGTIVGQHNLTLILCPPEDNAAANYSVSKTITVIP